MKVIIENLSEVQTRKLLSKLKKEGLLVFEEKYDSNFEDYILTTESTLRFTPDAWRVFIAKRSETKFEDYELETISVIQSEFCSKDTDTIDIIEVLFKTYDNFQHIKNEIGSSNLKESSNTKPEDKNIHDGIDVKLESKESKESEADDSLWNFRYSDLNISKEIVEEIRNFMRHVKEINEDKQQSIEENKKKSLEGSEELNAAKVENTANEILAKLDELNLDKGLKEAARTFATDVMNLFSSIGSKVKKSSTALKEAVKNDQTLDSKLQKIKESLLNVKDSMDERIRDDKNEPETISSYEEFRRKIIELTEGENSCESDCKCSETGKSEECSESASCKTKEPSLEKHHYIQVSENYNEFYKSKEAKVKIQDLILLKMKQNKAVAKLLKTSDINTSTPVTDVVTVDNFADLFILTEAYIAAAIDIIATHAELTNHCVDMDILTELSRKCFRFNNLRFEFTLHPIAVPYRFVKECPYVVKWTIEGESSDNLENSIYGESAVSLDCIPNRRFDEQSFVDFIMNVLLSYVSTLVCQEENKIAFIMEVVQSAEKYLNTK